MKIIVLAAILFASCSTKYVTYVQPHKIDTIDTLANGKIRVNLSPLQKATPLTKDKVREGEIVQVMSIRRNSK